MSIFSALFQRKQAIDLSLLGSDVHNHFLPGIDDGAQNIEESIAMILKMKSLGYSNIVMTPHIYPGLYENTPETIKKAFDLVCEKLQISPEIKLSFAAEYFFDETLFEKIEKLALLTFHGNHVLFEFSFSNKPKHTDRLFFELHAKNYRGILAHVERYPYFHQNLKAIKDIKSRGVLLQLNLLSLTGRYGPQVKKQAEILIDNGLVDLVSTDAHRLEHLTLLENNLNLKYFHALMKMPLKNFEWK